jgi:hypothetical protein
MPVVVGWPAGSGQAALPTFTLAVNELLVRLGSVTSFAVAVPVLAKVPMVDGAVTFSSMDTCPPLASEIGQEMAVPPAPSLVWLHAVVKVAPSTCA